MGVDPFIGQETSGKRGARRARVLLACKLKTPFGEVEGRLRDLSRKGALIECQQLPPVGSEVTFMRGATIVPARVAWAARGKVGLEFLFMIDEQEVLVQLRRTGSSQNQERFRRPGLNEETPEEARRLAEAWGVTVGLTVPWSDR
jgi:hypothetical protein